MIIKIWWFKNCKKSNINHLKPNQILMIYIDNWNNYKLATKTCIQNIKTIRMHQLYFRIPLQKPIMINNCWYKNYKMRIKHLKISFISKIDESILGVVDLISYIKIIIFHFFLYNIFDFSFIMIASNLIN